MALISSANIMFVCLIAASSILAQNSVFTRHSSSNGSTYVQTDASKFAMSTPEIVRANWKCISVNDGSVTFFGPTCSTLVKPLASLSPAEMALIQVQNMQHQMQVFGGNNQQTVVNHNSNSNIHVSQSSSSSGGSSMSSSSHSQHYSYSGASLPANLASVHIDNDLTTFVYPNRQVVMKPSACLSPEENQLMSKLKAEAAERGKQMEAQMQQMNQRFEQQMQDFHRRMDQMQQNMAVMFGNGFPFNNNNNPAQMASMQQQPWSFYG